MMPYLEKFKDRKTGGVQYDKLEEESSNGSSRTSNDMSHVPLDVFRPQKKRIWMCAIVSLGLVLLIAILIGQLALLLEAGYGPGNH